jgi:putative oxidoreductase
MRIVAGSALLYEGITTLVAGAAAVPAALHVVCGAIGAFLIAGLYTPIFGAFAVLAAALYGFANPPDAGCYVLLATLAGAIVLLGPGAWSIDARLFGWRRIEIAGGRRNGDRKSGETPPL